MKTKSPVSGPSEAAIEEARRVLGVHDHGTWCRCLACGDVLETARMLEEKSPLADLVVTVVVLFLVLVIVVFGVRGLP